MYNKSQKFDGELVMFKPEIYIRKSITKLTSFKSEASPTYLL